MRKSLMMACAAVAVVAAAVGGALAQPKQPQQVVTPPKAFYWMSATTGSGMMGFAAPQEGSGRPSMMDGMRAARQMMSGGGVSHQLELDLGSTLAATPGAPKAEHTPPPALQRRGVLPLETPRATPPGQPGTPGQPERPKGRLLIFWGCGEHARAGQPVIIDFARVAQGQWPTGLSSVTVNAPRPPGVTTHRTYGDWPNSIRPNGDGGLQASSSLLGEHVLRGNYTPEMRFTATQDFMSPITFTTNAKAPSGAINLVWNTLPAATGYAGWTFGAKGDDMVFWSTSEAKAFGVFQDYIPPAEAARLVRERALLAPTTTQCTVPVEVMTAMGAGAAPPAQGSGQPQGGGMLFFTAYGPEQNIIYPERPADARTPWNQEWFVKIRHRSSTIEMLGQSMSAMMSQNGQPAMTPEERCRQQREAQAQQRGSIGSAIGSATGIPGGGMIGGALGRIGRGKQKDQPATTTDPACPPQ